MLSRAQQAIESGEDVIIAGCPGNRGYACSYNIYGLASICYSCKRQRSRGLELLDGRYTFLSGPVSPVEEYCSDLSDEDLKDNWAAKAINFRSVDVGQAGYSSYTGKSRDLNVEGSLARPSLRKLISVSKQLTAYFIDVITKYKVSRVVLYNGRHNQNRPLLRVAQLAGNKIEVMEFSGQDASCVYMFLDTLPQDLSNLASMIETHWDAYSGDRETAAYRYFDLKRQGAVVNDRSYVMGQTPGRMPDGWDSTKKNIVIFNCSEDERASLGGDYEETLYPNQTDAVSRICESLSDVTDIKIYLRIHPNLSTVRWDFAMRLRRLAEKHRNVVVIQPESDISSYSLLKACDIVVSFGSTIGIEAAYWGKPSILLGRCVYERTGSVYVPRSHEEVITLLKQPALRPLPNIGAMKVGLFWGYGGETLKYFGGSRAAGFTFSNEHIRKSLFEYVLYAISKGIIEEQLLKYVNHYGDLWNKRIRRWFGSRE